MERLFLLLLLPTSSGFLPASASRASFTAWMLAGDVPDLGLPLWPFFMVSKVCWVCSVFQILYTALLFGGFLSGHFSENSAISWGWLTPFSFCRATNNLCSRVRSLLPLVFSSPFYLKSFKVEVHNISTLFWFKCPINIAVLFLIHFGLVWYFLFVCLYVYVFGKVFAQCMQSLFQILRKYVIWNNICHFLKLN